MTPRFNGPLTWSLVAIGMTVVVLLLARSARIGISAWRTRRPAETES